MSKEYKGPEFIEIGKLFYFPEEKVWQLESPATPDYVTVTETTRTDDFEGLVATIKEKAGIG